ncbi:MAG TPA: tetratricopeptide repeat protein [Saprospiraceae bacterium]|nr:tetratricopeptide repeat protein [Saprospiraceae bacterium]
MTNLLKKALFLMAMLVAKTAFGQSHAAGLEAMMLEDWDKAIGVFSGLAQANPADQSAFLSLGNAYLAKGDKANAIASFNKAFDAKTDAPMAFVANGRILLVQNNNLAEAEKQFNKAKKYAKKDMTTWRQIGESYFFYIQPGAKKPELEKAKQYLTEALEVSTKDFALQMTLGTCFKEMSEGGPAAQHYEYAEALEPQNPLPKLMLAKVYRIGKVPEKPLTYYDKAIAVAPTYSPALRGKAEYLFFVLGKYDEAQNAYKMLVEKGAEVKIEDEMQLANCYYLTKDCKNCSELVEKILKKDPSKNYLRRLQAYCDFENAQYERGLKILNDYFKIVPQDKILPSDYEYHAKLILQTKGDTTMAINDYKKVIEMDNSRWKLYEDIDKIEWNRKNYCGALKVYKMYLDSVATPKATEWYNLGMRYYFCKDEPMRYENAEKAFAKVTEINPAAAIGWLWAAKSAAFQDPSPDSIAVHPELANSYGKALPYYEKYSEIAGADKEKNKKDLLKAYQYIAYCYFVKVDAAKFTPVMDQWQALETDAAQQQVIKEMRDAFGKDAAPASGGGKNK